MVGHWWVISFILMDFVPANSRTFFIPLEPVAQILRPKTSGALRTQTRARVLSFLVPEGHQGGMVMFAHQLFGHQEPSYWGDSCILKLQFLIAPGGQCWPGKLQQRTKSISHADCFHSHLLAPSAGGRVRTRTSLNHTFAAPSSRTYYVGIYVKVAELFLRR